MTHKKSIPEAFLAYDQDNPKVYRLYKKFALWLIETKGKKKIGSKMIMERIRWEIYLETSDEEYRINNNYTPYFARKFMREYPQYADRFETRKLRNSQPVQGELNLAM